VTASSVVVMDDIIYTYPPPQGPNGGNEHCAEQKQAIEMLAYSENVKTVPFGFILP